MLRTYKDIGFSVQPIKVEDPTKVIEYLGTVTDSKVMELIGFVSYVVVSFVTLQNIRSYLDDSYNLKLIWAANDIRAGEFSVSDIQTFIVNMNLTMDVVVTMLVPIVPW